MPNPRICIVGGGATGLYALKELLGSGQPWSIVIYDRGDSTGPGMPYSPADNADFMLCNAFSREIPRVTQSLVDWLRKLPTRELNEWELSRNEVHARAFYPRVLIGEFLQHEFSELVKSAAATDCTVDVRKTTDVVDIGDAGNGRAFVRTSADAPVEVFDHVVIATGHVWPQAPQIEDVALFSPWPAARIAQLRENNIGILGSSLSAIDIVVALGCARGEFEESNGVVRWTPLLDQQQLKITMISKKGIMPEGDFYYPFPYEPLKIITAEAVNNEISLGNEKLLQRVFHLLLEELKLSDPDYVRGLGKEGLTIGEFGIAYFERRKKLGGLAAGRKDFVKVRKSMLERKTIPYRYVLLRAHETFDIALRSLNEADWKLFSENLLPVFADCYAAVPHLSIARVLALYDAGILDLVDTGEAAQFTKFQEHGVSVKTDEGSYNFDILLDARGQKAAPVGELPFASLVDLMGDKEIPISAPFKLNVAANPGLSIYCVAIPQLLERHPFTQGLQNCAEVAKVVVADIVSQRKISHR